jgi:hypothetical protein
MSKCEIKVLYVGKNRNKTFITEEVAAEIGKKLRGAPIVGYYKEQKEDFRDHGEKVIIDDEGIKFECKTVPYGFVSPDAKVWFQNFEDIDDITGEKTLRKYLMTTGYLWTEQFPECKLATDEGRPQSMEFKKELLEGNWQTDHAGIDFFIINDAVIQKLCILGDDIEPCFEGSSVTAPNVSTSYSLNKEFNKTLYSMMQDLKDILSKGGSQMADLEKAGLTKEEVVKAPAESYTDNASEVNSDMKEATASTDYAKDDEKKEKDESKNESEGKEDKESDSKDKDKDENKEDDSKEKEEKEKDAAKKYELLEEELNALKTSYSALQTEYEDLVKFKNEIENQKKDALISEFYMLSDADKADVINNKDKYSLDEIKAKLSVICFDKKINFTLDKESEVKEKEENPVITYSLDNDNGTDNVLPDWVRAVKEQEKII